jgi:hypothetical protein
VLPRRPNSLVDLDASAIPVDRSVVAADTVHTI